jgi:hypothetical protein
MRPVGCTKILDRTEREQLGELLQWKPTSGLRNCFNDLPRYSLL